MLLAGDTLQLTPYRAEEWQFLANWFYDANYKDMFRHSPRALRKEEFERYPQLINGEVFLLNLKTTNEVIGMIQLIPDHKTNRGFFMGLIIDKKHQGCRYPTEATYILLDYAFNRLGYRKAVMEVLKDNEPLNKTLELTGFIKEGTLVGEAFLNGKFVDEVRYCMFASYFNRKAQEELKKRNVWVDSSKQPQLRVVQR